MARSMFSMGMLTARAFSMASRSRPLAAGSGPPSRAATVICRDSLVNILPRRASSFSFLCLMLAHLECPAMDDHLTVKKSYHDAAFAAKGTSIAPKRRKTGRLADLSGKEKVKPRHHQNGHHGCSQAGQKQVVVGPMQYRRQADTVEDRRRRPGRVQPAPAKIKSHDAGEARVRE